MIRLLIVDDERATIRIIKKIINFEQYDIEVIGEAYNGDEAMSFINSARLSRLIALGVFKFALNNVAFISLFFLIILLKDSYRNTGLVHLEVDLYQDDNG